VAARTLESERMLTLLADGSPEFEALVRRLRARGAEDFDAVAPAVRAILADVRAHGDEAVLRYVERFERRTPPVLVTKRFDGAGALSRLSPPVREALELAAARIARYHEHQREPGFLYEEEGVTLGMRVRPLARVGVYAPGGKARYPSSVLMAAVPARVAGVREIVLATPAPDDAVLAAAHLAGVTELLDAGGAQAIGAMAYGTASLAAVDKIVGPGNAYVACAKRLVFGEVDIDGIAGPSEIVVLADASADARLVAADLLSQAEHDEDAWAILLTTSRALAEAAIAAVGEQLATQPRRAVIEASLGSRGVALVVSSRERLVALANAVAGEHVALHVSDPDALLADVGAAGAILAGPLSPVAAGDYLAGPSHVLPTGGCARFGSPLGVYDFVSRSSVIGYGPAALARHAPHITALARAEGLEAHARAVELRVEALGLGPRAVNEPQSGP
jgi:histidinol dehydrogenase